MQTSWEVGRSIGSSVSRNRDVTELHTDGYVVSSLRCAVWAIQQESSLEDVLVALVNRGDDADTTGAIAGGLLGVLHGAHSVPERWTQLLEYGPRFKEAAKRLEALREEWSGNKEPF